MWRTTKSFGLLTIGAAIFAVACADAPPTSPTGPTIEPAVVPNGHGESMRALMPCPTRRARSASAIIRPEHGGTIAVDGGSITIPAGAVTEPTLFTLTVPKTWYAAVDITADGRDSFEFETAVEIEIDYSRCRGARAQRNLDVGIIDRGEGHRGANRILERLDGRDDKAARRIEVDSNHLSTYVVVT